MYMMSICNMCKMRSIILLSHSFTWGLFWEHVTWRSQPRAWKRSMANSSSIINKDWLLHSFRKNAWNLSLNASFRLGILDLNLCICYYSTLCCSMGVLACLGLLVRPPQLDLCREEASKCQKLTCHSRKYTLTSSFTCSRVFHIQKWLYTGSICICLAQRLRG